MNEYRFNSMSTMVHISITRELFANDLMPVYKKFEQIEDLCSRFRPDSELSRINRQIGKEIPVSEELYTIFEAALRFYEETDFLILTIVTSKARKKIGYQRWRKLHALNPFLYIFVTVHGLLSGTDFQGTILSVVNLAPLLMMGMMMLEKKEKATAAN
ncbi:FAD:protein FMN transferase [Neobacillus sp. SM06]|uniref:FAD:protein FMN transferase n=1 Tax=Neobacillus sp. SM06 TaxID=3422492 RepID=UPI003D2DCE0E